jgi:hypothetical protein
VLGLALLGSDGIVIRKLILLRASYLALLASDADGGVIE